MNFLEYFLVCGEFMAVLVHRSTGIKCYECGGSISLERDCTEQVNYDTSLCVQEEDGELKDVCGFWADEKGAVKMRNCLSSVDIVKRVKVNGKPVEIGECYNNVTVEDSQTSFFGRDAGNDRVYGKFCSCFGDGCNRNSAILNRKSSFWAHLALILISILC